MGTTLVAPWNAGRVKDSNGYTFGVHAHRSGFDQEFIEYILCSNLCHTPTHIQSHIAFHFHSINGSRSPAPQQSEEIREGEVVVPQPAQHARERISICIHSARLAGLLRRYRRSASSLS